MLFYKYIKLETTRMSHIHLHRINEMTCKSRKLLQTNNKIEYQPNITIT